MTENNLIKHSSTIAISNNLSLHSRKLWNFLLANAFNDLKTKDIFSISFEVLKEQV
jgi:hypothetical protein